MRATDVMAVEIDTCCLENRLIFGEFVRLAFRSSGKRSELTIRD